MKVIFLGSLLFFSMNVLLSQESLDCEQLAIEYHGVMNEDEGDELVIEVSNFLYQGTLYHYPGFVLMNENGDTLAKERVTYYGIGTNFQTHLLEIKKEITFPFKGSLELFGSKYESHFCSFPITIERSEISSLNQVRDHQVKIVSNFAGDQMILELDADNKEREQFNYHFNITNENGIVVYYASLDNSMTSIPVARIGKSGYYYISIWDEISKSLLPSKRFWIEN